MKRNAADGLFTRPSSLAFGLRIRAEGVESIAGDRQPFRVALTPVNLLDAFIGCCLGTPIGVLPGIGPVATIAMLLAGIFGPAEYFSPRVLGLIGAVVLASGSLLKAFAMVLLGLLLGLVGTDVNSGIQRFSFDIPELMDGIGFVVIAMGIFGYGEIINKPGQSEKERGVFIGKVHGLFPT